MKPFQATRKLFKVVAGRRPEIVVTGGIVDHLELPKDAAFQIRRQAFVFPAIQEELPEIVIAPTLDHMLLVPLYRT